jgi:hypothetical protein
MRAFLAVVVSFVVMAVLTLGLSIVPWLIGLDFVLEPGRFDGKLAYDVDAFAVTRSAGVKGGALCRWIGRSSGAVAAPERVWRVLTDAASYEKWNPEILAVAGRFVAGEGIRARTARVAGR